HAAEVAGEIPNAVSPLVKALADDSPRVRDAALTSLAVLTDPRGKKVQAELWPAPLFPAVAKLLAEDPFSFVRAHAAESLRGAPAGDVGDAPLANALSDGSPQVRGRAIDMLGARGAHAQAGAIAERLDDEHENFDVRTRAARALGAVCDMGSADRLTELAKKGATVGADPESRILGATAAAALGHLAPPDLSSRLAPLLDPKAPRLAQQMGKAAMNSPEHCPKTVK
ncbi:MAG TPA: HEAT repeat domain-containing protein, partial [Polyangiaceae bacterium]